MFLWYSRASPAQHHFLNRNRFLTVQDLDDVHPLGRFGVFQSEGFANGQGLLGPYLSAEVLHQDGGLIGEVLLGAHATVGLLLDGSKGRLGPSLCRSVR